jgi:type IV pilus assembly protein PilV
MLMARCNNSRRLTQRQRGLGLIEILVSLLLLSFGLLALAGMQARMSQAQFESYQRTQALTLLADMTQRLRASTDVAAPGYLTSAPLGTLDTLDCSTQATRAKADQCDWSSALQGTAEIKSAQNSGAMTGARGCVELVQEEAVATCRPATYRVTVAWQGLSATTAPSLSCGRDLYGVDAQRRAISALVVKPLASC